MKKAAFVAATVMAILLAGSQPGHARMRSGVWIGPGWGPGWIGPPLIVRQEPRRGPEADPPVEPELQVEPESEQRYRYYCPDPRGYYPYVSQCPKGWMKVVPDGAPPEGEEEE